jgi:hypothetical protein
VKEHYKRNELYHEFSNDISIMSLAVGLLCLLH